MVLFCFVHSHFISVLLKEMETIVACCKKLSSYPIARNTVRPHEMEPLVHTSTLDEEDEMRGNSEAPLFLDDNGVGDDEDGDSWRQRLLLVQKVTMISAPIFALCAVVMVSVWISQLGGLSTQQGQSKLVFNWHPLMMIMAFLFMTVASLSFRYSQLPKSRISRVMAKWGHGLCWAVAALCMVFGLVAVFHSHNDPVSGFVANLYSLHSWIGITIVTLYFFQLLAGSGAFGLSGLVWISPTTKANLLQIHTFLGPLLYQGVLLTILLGIQEKEGFVGCGYKVQNADLRPWEHFHEIPAVCRTSHGLGLLVLLTGVLTSLALHPFERVHRRHPS